MTVRIKGTDDLRRRYEALPAKVKNTIKRAFSDYLLVLTRWMRERKLSGQVLNQRTGDLFRSVRHKKLRGGVAAEIMARHYGVAWDRGFNTPAIFPKGKSGFGGVLAWKDSSSPFAAKAGKYSGWVFTRYTRPRVNKARPWAMPALDETRTERFKMFINPVRRIIEEGTQ